MKTLAIFGLFFTGCLAALAQYNAPATGGQSEFWSGSPRLLVENGEASTVELSSTTVTANIIGIIADVTVRQVYVNRGAVAIEGAYVFPGSTRAAVYGMTMTVGGRVSRAVIREKEQARREYNAAREEGKAASLLEMLRPNVFRMNVANVLPGDSVITEMRYTEGVPLSDGIYEFVYPAVVGPRYAGGTQNAVDYALSRKDLPSEIPGKFSISTNISAGVPLREALSPSHKITAETFDARTERRVGGAAPNTITRVGISAADTGKKNRDFVLRYALTGRVMESGLLLSKGKDENFFMLMVQPPQTVEIPNIVPREFIFIVDVSGSMGGQPLAIAQRLMDSLFTSLRPEDKFNIMMFSGGQAVLGEQSLPATKENIAKAAMFLRSGFGGGGTELLSALRRALEMPSDSGYARSFVAVTDGYVAVGREAFKLVRQSLNNANIYAFGIGGSVNRYLIEGLARAGNADPMIVTNWNEAPAMADKFRRYIEAPVLTDIKVNFGKLEAYDVDPQSIADVTSKRPIVVFGKWRGKPEGTVRLTGAAANGAYSVNVDVEAAPIRPENTALRYLWARNRIGMIEDEAQDQMQRHTLPEDERKTITDIGLKYNLLTRFTSFVAIDSVVSAPGKISQKQADTIFEVRGEQNAQPPGKGTFVQSKTKKLEISTIGKAGGKIEDANIARADVKATDQLTPGIQSGNGFTIRGSRAAENSVKVDGLETGDKVQFAPPQRPTVGQQQSGTLPPAGQQSGTLPPAGQVSGAYPVPNAGGQASSTGTVHTTRPAASTSSTTTESVQSVAVTAGDGDDMDFSDPLEPKKAPPRLYAGLLGFFNRSSVSGMAAETLTGAAMATRSEPANGYSLGLHAEYTLGDPRSSGNSLLLQLMYDRVNFYNSLNDSVLSASLTNVMGNYTMNTNASRIALNLAYSMRVWRGFSVFGGAGVNYTFGAERTYTVTGDVPLCPCAVPAENIENSGKTLRYIEGDVPDVRRVGVNVLAGVAYDFLVGKWILKPTIQADYHLTTLSPNIGRPFILRLGISLGRAGF